MTTVHLNRSEDDFWDMTFRQIVCLIDQWRDIEKNREMLRKFLADGGDPDDIGVTAGDIRDRELEMGAAMW